MFKHLRCLVDRFQDVVSNHANFISIPIERAVELGFSNSPAIILDIPGSIIHNLFSHCRKKVMPSL